MGYSTDFFGKFNLDKKLTDDQAEYLRLYSDTRHCTRRGSTSNLMDRLNIPFGKDGEFVAEIEDNYFSNSKKDRDSYRTLVIDYNDPPGDCPGLWCNWAPTKDNFGIEWNGAEKFYNYVEWLNFILENFLVPWGYNLTGYVRFQGEDQFDKGYIRIKNNFAYIDLENLIFD